MNRINKLLDKLKSDINDTKDIDNDWFVEQALTTLDKLKKQLTLSGVSQQRELLNALADKFNESTHTYIGQPMIEETLKAFNCA